jgi:molybdopterin/thiamine biosynthesis adenylyltransferase/rhodanese-related sulfurtransferase
MFSDSERQRYARHFSLPEFGEEGQCRLRASSVLCVGAGGLGSPILMYLAAAGVGRIGIVDADRVDLSNLQRQILHGTSNIGERKTDSARARLHEINPEVEIVTHEVLFKADNAMALAAPYDLLVDGTDNFPTRYLSNDVAVFLKKPNVYGSIFRFEGQCTVFAPHLGSPCYRCLFPEPPEPGLVPSCAEGGVLGVLPGIIGSLQAMEAIKLLAGIGDSLAGRLIHYDALAPRFREFKLRRDPECPVCGDHPTITEPIDYHQFCGMPNPDTLPSVTVHELAAKRARGEQFTLIDVREPDEYAASRIEGSQLIPLATLPDHLNALEKASEILVHCKAGGRSAQAVQLLLDAGFGNVHNVEGGIDAWNARA